MSTPLSYTDYNAALNLYDKDGKIQFDMDKEAARQYFLQHVNQKTTFFHDLEEKHKFLLENDYYEKEFLDLYDFEDVKNLYKRAYAKKFRFPTFAGAYKFYTSYALKTFNGENYLERYEDRVVICALYLANGDLNMATELVDSIMSGQFQPATPTFLNAGRKQRGELVSCFPAGSLVDTIDGRKPIETVVEGDLVLTHDGSYKAVTGTMSRMERAGLVTLRVAGSEPLILTPEHPVLVAGADKSRAIDALRKKDGSGSVLRWVAAQDVSKGDYVVAAFPTEVNSLTEISLLDYLPNDSDYVEQEGLIYKKNKDKKNVRKGNLVSQTFTPIKNAVPLNEDFGRFVGYFLAEGYVIRNLKDGRSIGTKGLNFTFGSHEQAFLEDVSALAQNLFGVAPKAKTNRDGSTNVYVNSSVLGQAFLSLLGTGYDTKRLPVELLHANADFQRGLLVGAYRGDGCTTSSAVTMSLVNPELVHQLRNVALRLGMLARTRSFINQAGNLTSNLDITGFPGNEWDFIMDVAKNTDKFIGANPKFSNVSRWIEGSPTYRVEESSFTPGEVEVFNLEVEGNHTYSVAGHVVHNCFLLRTEDNMESISRAINSSLQLSKRGGGVALLLTNLRETGAPIKKVEGQSSGVVPVMKLLEDAFSYANQLGQRNGSGAVYLHAHHPDIEIFLDTKRENADEKIRIKSLSLGIVVPDITFELARDNKDMYLFSPYDVERVYGKPMSDISISEHYWDMVDNPEIRKRKIKARAFFQMVADVQIQSGYPYIVFEDTVNKANPIEGRINMSNLCSEILQINTPSTYQRNLNYDTVGRDISCNLGSLNVARVMQHGNIGEVVETAMRALTNVSLMTDIQEVPSIANGNDKSHSVGLGAMNLAGYFGQERMFYGSEESIDFTNMFFYTVNYHSLVASNKIAIEKGESFEGFENSEYANGSYFTKYIEQEWAPATEKVATLFREAGIAIPTQEDWKALAASVQEKGLFNAYRLAIPPTGSISYLNYATASIHPISQKIEIRKEGKLGRLYVPAFGLTNDNLEYYQDAYELGNAKVCDVYAAATQHVDQGLSLTFFYTEGATTRDYIKAMKDAWMKGIKTIYYSRIRAQALGTTDVEGCVSCAL